MEFMLSGRSFPVINIKKRMGANMESWGTPDNTGAGSEQTPSITTFCVCPDPLEDIIWDTIIYYHLYSNLKTSTVLHE